MKLKSISQLLPWKNSNQVDNSKNNKEMDADKLISLKENFTGQKFQWIKTDRADLLAKVVRCRDVDFAPNGRFIVKFDDGSSIDSSRLNNDLLMIHGDMQPLSKEEVTAIYGSSPKPQVKSPVVKEEIQTVQPASPQPTVPPVAQTVAQQAVPPKTNMFSMFNSEESQLTINLFVKIPDKKLLKMMYSNAEDKNKFMSELAEYLHGMINKKVVQDSIQAILAPPSIKKEIKPVINLTEVNDCK